MNDLGKKMITKIPQYIYIYIYIYGKINRKFSDMHKVANSWHEWFGSLGHWVLGFAFGYWQGMQGSDFEGFVNDKNFKIFF